MLNKFTFYLLAFIVLVAVLWLRPSNLVGSVRQPNKDDWLPTQRVCMVMALCRLLILCMCFVKLDTTEDNAKLQAVVSLLTTGPVGVSDKIGYTDIDLVHRSVLLSVVILPV